MKRTILRASALALGLTAGVAALSTAPAHAYSVWKAVHSGKADGVITNYDDGRALVVVQYDGGFELLVHNPAWRLRVGDEVDFSFDIDSDRFYGTARAVSRTDLKVPVLTPTATRAPSTSSMIIGISI